MSLTIRRLIRWVDSNDKISLHRILEVHEELGLVCTFDCTDPPRTSVALPERRRIVDIEEAIQSGAAVLLDYADDPFQPGNCSNLTALQKAAQERSYQLIQELVEQHSVLALTSRSTRGPTIRRACVSYQSTLGTCHRVCHKTVWATLRAWWRGGMVLAALVHNHRARGTAPPTSGSRKAGRKPSVPSGRDAPTDLSLSTSDIRNLQNGFERFRVKKQMPLILAYSRTLMAYWPILTMRPDGTIETSLPAQGTAPSFNQWYYHGRKLLGDKNSSSRNKRLRQLYGERTFDENMRPEMLSVSRLSEGPGWLCQYDATPFPITLVREDDRSQVIGTPLLYTLTDVKTHFIFEPFITLENDSYGAAQRGIYEICRKHDDHEERVVGTPNELGLPNGPYTALDSDRMASMLGVRIEQGRAYFPLGRMLIEATHRMLELMLKELEGTYDWHPDVPDKRNPALAGALTLSEFRKAVRMAVNYLNEWSEIDDYPMDADMVEANIRPYRLDLWEFCQGRRPKGFHVWPDDHLRLHLMPGGEATVTPKGLLFEGEYYTCERAVREDWYGEEQRRRHLGRRQGQARKVAIARHWTLRDVLYLREPDQKTLEPCVLVDPLSAWTGKTWSEYGAWKTLQDTMAYDERDPKLQARLDLSDALQSINKKAKSRAQHDKKGKSNAEVVKGVARYRRLERASIREQDRPPENGSAIETPRGAEAHMIPASSSPRPHYAHLLRQIKTQEGSHDDP